MIFMRKTINFGERNQPKQMERYTMLTDRKKKNIEISVLPIFFSIDLIKSQPRSHQVILYISVK